MLPVLIVRKPRVRSIPITQLIYKVPIMGVVEESFFLYKPDLTKTLRGAVIAQYLPLFQYTVMKQSLPTLSVVHWMNGDN